MADRISVDSLFDRFLPCAGDIDILVNNAGHDVRRRFDQGEMAEWQSIVETNVVGPVRVTRSSPMVARPWPS